MTNARHSSFPAAIFHQRPSLFISLTAYMYIYKADDKFLKLSPQEELQTLRELPRVLSAKRFY